MNTECLSTYCPPRSLLSSYSGILSNPEITLRFFFFLHLPKLLLQVRMYSSFVPLSFPSPTHFQKPTYTFSLRLDFLPPVPKLKGLSPLQIPSLIITLIIVGFAISLVFLSIYLLVKMI